MSFLDGKIIHLSINLHSHQTLHTSQEKAVMEYLDVKITEDLGSTCHVEIPFPHFFLQGLCLYHANELINLNLEL